MTIEEDLKQECEDHRKECLCKCHKYSDRIQKDLVKKQDEKK